MNERSLMSTGRGRWVRVRRHRVQKGAPATWPTVRRKQVVLPNPFPAELRVASPSGAVLVDARLNPSPVPGRGQPLPEGQLLTFPEAGISQANACASEDGQRDTVTRRNPRLRRNSARYQRGHCLDPYGDTLNTRPSLTMRWRSMDTSAGSRAWSGGRPGRSTFIKSR